MTIQYSDVEMWYHLRVLETSTNDAVGEIFSMQSAKMLHDIISRTHLDVTCPSISGDQSSRVEHMIVWLQLGGRVVRPKPPSDRIHLPWNAAVLSQPPPGGDDDRCRGALGMNGRGGEQQGVGVEQPGVGFERVPLRAGRSWKIAQGEAVEGGTRNRLFVKRYGLRL